MNNKPEKKITDEDFMNLYEAKDRKEGRLDKYSKDKESKSFNFIWIISLVIIFLVAYLLISRLMFPPKI
jgi:hypothetical protein